MFVETGRTDKQSLYRRNLEVKVVMSAVSKLMYWSDQAIGWDRVDHPKIMPNPEGYALVMDPTFVEPANCNAPPFAKGRTPVICAIPWISR
jgi:hypothetical protein